MRTLIFFDGSQAGLIHLQFACREAYKSYQSLAEVNTSTTILIAMFVKVALGNAEMEQLTCYEDNSAANEELLDSALALTQSCGFQNVSGEILCLGTAAELPVALANLAQEWQADAICLPSTQSFRSRRSTGT